MSLNPSQLLGRLAAAVFAAIVLASTSALAETAGIKRDKIGIYDLAAIHAIDLKPEVISKTEDGDIVYEKVRFSSVDNIRVFAILSYKKGASHLPGMLIVDRFRAAAKKAEATNGYFAISVAPPNGNTDPKMDMSLGGTRYGRDFSIDDQFIENYHESYIYQHNVALLRALDYMETRPEVDVSKTVVTGYSWPGLMVATLHGLDDRPCAYVLWHGLGYFADEQGKSGGATALFNRKMYEMYGAGYYAPYGTKPLYAGVALDDYFTMLDSIIEVYTHLKSPKVFAFAPNRHHRSTARGELDETAAYLWQTHWQLGTEEPPTVGKGTVKVQDGKLIYSCTVDSKHPIQWSEIYVSYGKPGTWMARTWHTFPLEKKGDGYEAEIPVYDPATPLYVVGQFDIKSPTDPKVNCAFGNCPQFVEPSKLGISASNAQVPHVLFDPSQKNDLYLRTGTPEWSSDSSDGKGSVIMKLVGDDHGTVIVQNVEPNLWKTAQEIHIWLKGDGKSGPLTAYLNYDGNYYLDHDVKSYTAFPLVPSGGTMANGWKEYTIKLSDAANLDRVGSLFLEPGAHTLQIGTVSWK